MQVTKREQALKTWGGSWGKFPSEEIPQKPANPAGRDGDNHRHVVLQWGTEKRGGGGGEMGRKGDQKVLGQAPKKTKEKSAHR